MQGGIWSLYRHRLTALELVELGVIHIDRGTDVARLPDLSIAWALGVVAWQSVRATKAERTSPGSVASTWTVVCGTLLRTSSAVGTDLAGGDAFLVVAEDVAGEDVDNAKDDDENAARDDNLPEGSPERLLARCLLVQISQDRDAENDH